MHVTAKDSFCAWWSNAGSIQHQGGVYIPGMSVRRSKPERERQNYRSGQNAGAIRLPAGTRGFIWSHQYRGYGIKKGRKLFIKIYPLPMRNYDVGSVMTLQTTNMGYTYRWSLKTREWSRQTSEGDLCMQITIFQAILIGIVYYLGIILGPVDRCHTGSWVCSKSRLWWYTCSLILGRPAEGVIIGAAIQLHIAFIQPAVPYRLIRDWQGAMALGHSGKCRSGHRNYAGGAAGP